MICSCGAGGGSARTHLPRSGLGAAGLALDGEAHASGRAFDDLHGTGDIDGVEVLHLQLRDLLDRRAGHRADLVAVGLAGAPLDRRRLEQQPRGRRRLDHKGEGAILEDRDLHRDDVALLRLRALVVGLAELHDVDAVLTQGGTDGRRRRRLASGDLELDLGHDLLGHLGTHFRLDWRIEAAPVSPERAKRPYPPRRTDRCRRHNLATWSKPNSTGVSRPKLDTRPLRLEASALISEMVPVKSAKGPEITRRIARSSTSTL